MSIQALLLRQCRTPATVVVSYDSALDESGVFARNWGYTGEIDDENCDGKHLPQLCRSLCFVVGFFRSHISFVRRTPFLLLSPRGVSFLSRTRYYGT